MFYIVLVDAQHLEFTSWGRLSDFSKECVTQ